MNVQKEEFSQNSNSSQAKKAELLLSQHLSQCSQFAEPPNNDYLLKKIENCLMFFQQSLTGYPRPTLYVSGLDESHALEIGRLTPYRFACIFTLLSEIYKLVSTNTTRTKRAIYYDYRQLFQTTSCLDLTLNHVCRLLMETRKNLHIVTTSKGMVMGDLRFVLKDGCEVSCQLPASIPPNVDDIVEFRTKAKFILIVEKDSVFQKLCCEEFCSFYAPCILVTAKGYPDFATRMFLLKLNLNYNLPLFGLMDGDPHGIEIYLTYKYGSATQRTNINVDNAKLNSIRWIGVFPSEISNLTMDQSKYLQLTNLEKRKIEIMLERSFIKEDSFLKQQLEKMMEFGVKIELEALCSLGDDYLTSTYLKLKFEKLLKNLLPEE